MFPAPLRGTGYLIQLEPALTTLLWGGEGGLRIDLTYALRAARPRPLIARLRRKRQVELAHVGQNRRAEEEHLDGLEGRGILVGRNGDLFGGQYSAGGVYAAARIDEHADGGGRCCQRLAQRRAIVRVRGDMRVGDGIALHGVKGVVCV